MYSSVFSWIVVQSSFHFECESGTLATVFSNNFDDSFMELMVSLYRVTLAAICLLSCLSPSLHCALGGFLCISD